MPDLARTRRLAAALAAAERDAQGWTFYAIPAALGVLLLGIVVLADLSPGVLTETTRRGLAVALDRYFVRVDGAAFAVALLVFQAPYLFAVFVATVSFQTARSLVGRRVVVGEFETLLAAPYGHDDVFAALVLAGTRLVFRQTVALAVVSLGGGWLFALARGATFTLAVGSGVFAAYLVPVVTTAWAALVSVGVYLAYPGTSLSGTSAGNALMLAALVPPLALLFLATSGGVSPVLVALLGVVGVAAATAVGAATLHWWFAPERVV